MRFLSFILIGVIFLQGMTLAITPWIEIWNNGGYYQSNFERVGFSSLLLRYQGKVGARLPFGDPYLIWDGTTSQDSRHWNNQIIYGIGIRAYSFRKFPFPALLGFLREAKLFAEIDQIQYFKDAGTAAANKRSDTRFGLDLWYEWNQADVDHGRPWAEMWSNLSYRSTNFSSTDFNAYIFYFQPKAGIYLSSLIKPYIKVDLVVSNNSSYWLNTLAYGAGIRFEPFRENAPEEWYGPFVNKFSMFVEVANLNYLRAANPAPVMQDVRFGIDLSYGR